MSKKTVNAMIKLVHSYSDGNEITSKIILGTQANNLDFRVKRAQAQAAQVLTELREMTENFNGSEVQQAKIERKQDYATGVFSTYESLQAMFMDTKEAYKEISGETWTPYIKKSDRNPKDVVEIPDGAADLMNKMDAALNG